MRSESVSHTASGGAVVRIQARVLVPAAFALALAVSPVAASADGLHLKLSADAPKVTADQPAKVKVVAMAMRTLSLPATPTFLVEDGAGQPANAAAKALDDQGRIAVTPDKTHTGGYELTLDKPGTYKVQAEYRVDDRVVRSNKVTIEVVAAGTERAAQ